MTDKATMPGEVWVKLYRSDGGTAHMDAVPFLMDDRTGYTQTSIHQALQNDYLALAAVAGRMAEAIDAGIDRLSVDYPKDRIAADKMNEALSAYNALMKGR